MIFCRYCGKEIHEAAPSCPHCGGIQQPSVVATKTADEGGSLWMAVTSLVLGIFWTLLFIDESGSGMNKDTVLGIGLFAAGSLTLGAISLSKKKAGKGMAIAGVAVSAFLLLAVVGSF